MRKPNSDKKSEAFLKISGIKYIILLVLIVMVSVMFIGCGTAGPLVNSPTPAPSNTITPTHSPAPNTMSSPREQAASSSNASPVYDETYPIPETIGNTGANIETGGLSTSDKNRIYYIDNGIWSMSKDGTNKKLITDMENISCLNDVEDYIYFLSSHDGTIYRVTKEENSIPESLGISGAGSLIIIDDYMYYSASVGENSTNYIYKAPLYGILQECLFVKANFITPDGAYFYFNNLEDDGTLWRYDTISSQIVKISNDKPSQVNVINDKIYYISENTDYNVVCIDRNGLNQVVVVTKGCTDLNIIRNYLIYRTIDTGYIQSYNIKTGETVPLVNYDGELFSLSATDNMIFFQSCPVDGFEPETYVFDLVSSKLNKPLPQKIFAVVKDINLDDLTLHYDRVEYFEGDEAVKQYCAYNNASVDYAQNATDTEEGFFYIYNKQPAWIRVQSQDWTQITLVRRPTSLSSNTPYTASLEELEALFENNPKIEGKLLFELTIIDKKVVAMNEIYYAIDTKN